MLALTDSALARLCIAATRVDPRRRGQWLRQIAERIDPQIMNLNDNRDRTPAARRQAKVRARRRNATRCYTVEIPDQIAEGVITALVATGRLTEIETLDHKRVQAELGRMICEWAKHWLR
jgi:hypothetical protein